MSVSPLDATREVQVERIDRDLSNVACTNAIPGCDVR